MYWPASYSAWKCLVRSSLQIMLVCTMYMSQGAWHQHQLFLKICTLQTAVTSQHTWLGGVPGNPLNDAAVPHSDPVKGRLDGPILQRQHE